MVKIKGPLMSLEATGGVDATMIFSTWKGRPYVRTQPKTRDPETGPQKAARAGIIFLSQAWKTIIAGIQISWQPLADEAYTAPFHQYMKYNLLRHRNFLAPTVIYPATLAFPPEPIDTFSATPGTRHITVLISPAAPGAAIWGFYLFRSTSTGFTPAFDNCIAMLPADGLNNVTYMDTQLAPDTYYYDAKPFSIVAAIGPLKGEINATVS